MPQLPKSVIERMKSQPGAQGHPDANLLAAFTEQALTGRERDYVLAHLAACAECRATVSLAQPEIEAEQTVVSVPWYQRPQIFAWSAAVATLVVGAALLVNYGDRRQPAPARQVVTSDSATVAAKQKGELAQQANPQDVGATVEQKATAKPYTKNAQNAVVAPSQKLKVANDEIAKKDIGHPLMNAPAAAKPEAKRGIAAGDEKAAAGLHEQAVAAPPPPQATSAANAALAREQPSSTTESVAVQSEARAAQPAAGVVGGVVSRPSKTKAAELAKVSTVTRWSISDAGQLQRSSDSGLTWQPVAVAGGGSFRAVAVVGTDVWAGGAGAILYHTSDDGATWTRQQLPETTATITSISFSDTIRGTARTADGASFATSDAGAHWARQ